MTNAFRPSTAAALAIVTMTSLIPYNLFMNAHEYFYYKLRDANATGLNVADDLFEVVSGARNHSRIVIEPTTELQTMYEGWFTMTSGVTCILGALVNTVATNRLSNSFRVLVGHAIVLLSLVPTLLYTFIDTDQDQVHFFWSTMLFSSISSFASSGLIGAGIQGLAAAYSASYVRVVMIASAVAGMGTSLLSIVCQAATSNAVLNGRIYFGIAFVWTIISIFCYLYLINSSQEKESVEMDSDPIVDDNDDEDEDDVDSPENTRRHDEAVNSHSDNSTSLFGGWGTIMKQSGADMACTMFIILVSCSAFPALASQVRPHTANSTWRAYFSSICCFLLYGFADGLGRIFAMRISISRRTLQNLSLARLLLLPLIAVCDVQPRHHSPTLIRNDAVFTSLIMALALSFGFCYTHAYVKAIQSVDPALREKAGSLMSLASNVIALIGCMIGVAIVTLM